MKFQLNGLGVVLSIIFMVLKLTGHIAWSWLWVFAPMWIPIGLVILIFVLMAIFAGGVAAAMKHLK